LKIGNGLAVMDKANDFSILGFTSQFSSKKPWPYRFTARASQKTFFEYVTIEGLNYVK
jgi:hypothetical protein